MKILALLGLGLNLTAIVLSKSSIPYGVLIAAVAGYFLFQIKTKKQFLILVALCLLPVIVGYLTQGMELFDSAKRFRAYEVFMGEWWRSGRFTLFGTGPSTFAALSREIQLKSGFEVNADGTMWAWRWMHSDLLQTVFEWGIIGSVLWFIVLLEVFYKLYAKRQRVIFGIALGLLSATVFDYPCRYASTAFLIGYCLVSAYRVEPS